MAYANIPKKVNKSDAELINHGESVSRISRSQKTVFDVEVEE